jgi:hypothetical protein
MRVRTVGAERYDCGTAGALWHTGLCGGAWRLAAIVEVPKYVLQCSKIRRPRNLNSHCRVQSLIKHKTLWRFLMQARNEAQLNRNKRAT